MTHKVAVLFGGPGPEHEVSLGSATSVLTELQQLGWDVLAVGISKDGRWFAGPAALSQVLALADPGKLPLGVVPPAPLPPLTTPAAAPTGDPAAHASTVFAGPPPRDLFTGYELVLPLCHGSWGEDGTLQGLLTAYDLTIIGCGVTASAVCFDKQLTKTLLTAAGLPVSPGTAVKKQHWQRDPDATLETIAPRTESGPWFVKPNRSGSSIGVTAVHHRADLPAAIDTALRWDDTALVESYIPHRELLLGVVGRDSQLTVSPPLECVQAGEVLDYEQKYRAGQLRFAPPADLDPQLIEQARRLAGAAFEALGCTAFARVDLFLDTRDNSLLVNEVNTVPGMTAQSAFSQLMTAAGLPYPALLETLYELTEENR